MENYDVIVIGASIAGSAFAKKAASEGKRILLIDKMKFPRDRLSTHFMWPRGVSYLNRLGVADRILSKTPHFKEMEVSIEGIVLRGSIPMKELEVRFSLLHGSTDSLTDLYCGPRRTLLDSELLLSAIEQGVVFKPEVEFASVITEGDSVVGISMKTVSGTNFKASARVVVAADGKNSTFADAVKSDFIDYRTDSSFAFFGYFSGLTNKGLTIRNKGRLGTAVFPTSDGTNLVLVYGPCEWWKEFMSDSVRNFYKTLNFCDEELHQLMISSQQHGSFKGCGKMDAFQRQNVGKGWVLIGDACSFKDQITAMGMTHALRDAELINECLRNGFDESKNIDDCLKEYQLRRYKDYAAYFNYVCQTAQIRVKSDIEIQALSEISKSRERIEGFLSVFGDTKYFPSDWVKPSFEIIQGTGFFKGRLGYEVCPYKI